MPVEDVPSGGRRIPDCHDDIYEALKNGNRELAQQAMREHIQFFRDTLLRALEAAEKSSAAANEEADLAAAGSVGSV